MFLSTERAFNLCIFTTVHQPICFLLTLSLKMYRMCFILNCQIYHKQCRKESDMLIKFTTTARNCSELSNRKKKTKKNKPVVTCTRSYLFFFISSGWTECKSVYAFEARSRPNFSSFWRKERKETLVKRWRIVWFLKKIQYKCQY